MIRYKRDILQMLKDAGYNTTRIRKEKLISEATLTNIRKGKPIEQFSIVVLKIFFNHVHICISSNEMR